MKKAIQININDKIYFINDDAYQLLQNYLSQLAATFPDEEGQEIVIDIENRIGELFDEYVSRGRNVVDIAFVNKVIDTVGKPEEINCEEESASEPPHPYPSADMAQVKTEKKLYRDPNDKVLGGVLGGIAQYFDWDSTILRVIVVVIALTTAVFPCFLCYLIAWMVIPEANTPQRQLEMRGEKVTIDSIMQNIKDQVTPPKFTEKQISSTKNFISECFRICSKLILGVIIAVAALIGCGVMIWILFSLFFLIFGSISGFEYMANTLSLDQYFTPLQFVNMMLSGAIALIACIAVIWGIGALGFNWKRPSNAAIITFSVIFIILIAATTIITFSLKGMDVSTWPF